MTRAFRGLSGLAVPLLLATLPTAALAQSKDSMRPPSSTPPPREITRGDTAPAGGLVDAQDPKALVELLQKLGYKAVLSKDSEGYPYISSKLSYSNYDIYFYGCEGETRCTHLEFIASWQMNSPVPVATANKWNNSKIFGKASVLDDGAARLTLAYNLDGGVSESNFEDTLDWWRIALTEWEKEIGFVK